MNSKLTGLFIAILMLASLNVNADALKIGYVQVDKILKEAPQTKSSGQKLKKEFGPRSTELESLAKKIKTKQTALEKDALTLSETARRNKERDLQNLQTEFKRKQRELGEDINLRKNEELGKLQDRVNKAVQTVSEAEGYDLVIYSGVAYANQKVDITDKVLKSLGKK